MSGWRTARSAAIAIALGALCVAPAGGASRSETSVRNGEITIIRKSNIYGEGVLLAVNPSTGKVRRLLGSGWVRSAAWSPDGKRIAIVDKCVIKVMPASGGRLRTILRPRKWSNSAGGEVSWCYTEVDWSSDGRRLVFTRCSEQTCEIGPGRALFTIETSGRGLRQFTQRDCRSGRLWWCLGVGDGFADWSPDGERMVFQRLDTTLPDPLHGNWANNARLYRVNADGSGLEQLPPAQARSPEWSPDGTHIAFVRLVWSKPPPGATGKLAAHLVMNADGSGEKTLVQVGEEGGCGWWSAAWAPDGSRLAYTGPCPQGIYTMAPDGSDQVRLTSGRDRIVSWRPLP